MLDLNKDYYAVLGVMPTAEDIVIKAAYKALAQRYHPDRNRERAEEATQRIAEINEAYTVLSNPATRQQYDNYRGEKTQSGDAYFRADSESPPSYDPLEEDWSVAAKYYPSLRELDQLLARISWRLAYSFRAYIIESKEFERGSQIAEQMRGEFLKVYFGSDSQIVRFANELILAGEKAAARELNKTIRVLGSSTKAEQVIWRIKDDFALFAEDEANREAQPLIEWLVANGYSVKRNDTRWEITKAGKHATVNTILELAAFSRAATNRTIEDDTLGAKGGLIVCAVKPRNSFKTSEILVGDVIIKVGDFDVRYKKRDFERAMRESTPLSEFQIQLYRENRPMIVKTNPTDFELDVAQLV
jgi:curved DNA-binding protein CbpA